MNKDEEKELLTIDDLERIFIRAQFPDGHWGSINVRECSDLQFDTWAKSRREIQGEYEPWDLVERADFCNTLWQAGALHILKKDVDFEEEL
jgi:hypothetical protein